MAWSKRVSPTEVICLFCGRNIALKPRCQSDRHAAYYRRRRASNNAYRREKRKANSSYANYNPEQRRAYEKRKHRDRRTELIVRLGGKCASCPVSDPVVLEIHHRNGEGCAERKRLGWKYLKHLLGLSLAQLKKDYEVLCANCHVRKTRSHPEEEN